MNERLSLVRWFQPAGRSSAIASLLFGLGSNGCFEPDGVVVPDRGPPKDADMASTGDPVDPGVATTGDPGSATTGADTGSDPGGGPTCSDAVANQGEVGIDCGGPCPPCIACVTGADCDSGLCEGGNCITSRLAACVDQPPANAVTTSVEVPIAFVPGQGWENPGVCPWGCVTDFALEEGACINERTVTCGADVPGFAVPIAQDVLVHYTDATGWETPPTCAWSCRTNYCEVDGGCIRDVGSVVMGYDDVVSGSGYFGGDLSGTPRSVGSGMRITPTVTLDMHGYEMSFRDGFRDASGTQEVVVVLDLRSESGELLQRARRTVTNGQLGNWFTWEVEQVLDAGATYSFAAYVEDGLQNGVNASVIADSSAGDPDAQGISSRIGPDTVGHDDPSVWGEHPWDYHYHILGPSPCDE